MNDTPEPPEEFPAGLGAKLVLTLTPFLVLAVVWWLVARFAG
jgi:hypothetical protein